MHPTPKTSIHCAVDVTVARTDRIASRLFRAAEYLRVPEWLRMGAPDPVSDEAFCARDANRAKNPPSRGGPPTIPPLPSTHGTKTGALADGDASCRIARSRLHLPEGDDVHTSAYDVSPHDTGTYRDGDA